MSEWESLPWYSLTLPMVLVAGSWLVSKLLRFQFLPTLLVSTLPLGLPFVELPLAQEFAQLRPELLIGSGWVVLLAFALGWVVVRPLIVTGMKGFGLVKMMYVAVLGASLLVVALLVSRPELMNSYMPGWKGGAGVVLLCASLLSMSCALARIFRAALMFSVWAMVSLVLASEIFLDKLPQELVREDLRQIEELVPQRLIDSAIENLNVAAPEGVSKFKAFVLGGTAATGFPFSQGRGLADRIQERLRSAGAEVQVHDASVRGASIYDLRRISREKLIPAKPDLVLLFGWSPDSEKGTNSYGLTGLTEREAIERVQRASKVRQIPFAESVLTSTLYRYLRGQEDAIPTREQPIARVPVEEYRAELRETVRELRSSGTQVVLVSEPSLADSEVEYRDAMLQVAAAEGAPFIPLFEEVERHRDPLLFGRGKLLSDKGYNAVANSMSRYLSSFVGGQVVPEGRADAARDGAAPLAEFGVQGQSVRMVVRPSDVTGDLVFKVRMPEQGTRFYRVTFTANGEFVADKRLDSRDSVRVRFQLPEQYRAFPIVELGLRTVASPPLESDRIGSSDAYLPVPVDVEMRPDRETSIKIGESVHYSAHPFSAVAVDHRSGEVLTSIASSNLNDLATWSRSLAWGTIVVGALANPGSSPTPPAVALKGISGGVLFPPLGERTAFVGLVGGLKGHVVSRTAKDAVVLTLGSPIVSAYNRFILEEAQVNEQPLIRLDT